MLDILNIPVYTQKREVTSFMCGRQGDVWLLLSTSATHLLPWALPVETRLASATYMVGKGGVFSQLFFFFQVIVGNL